MEVAGNKKNFMPDKSSRRGEWKGGGGRTRCATLVTGRGEAHRGLEMSRDK